MAQQISPSGTDPRFGSLLFFMASLFIVQGSRVQRFRGSGVKRFKVQFIVFGFDPP